MRNEENHFVFPFCFTYGSYIDKSRDLSSDFNFTLFRRYLSCGINLVTEHPVSISIENVARIYLYDNFLCFICVTFLLFLLQS